MADNLLQADVNEEERPAEVTTDSLGLMNIALQDKKMYAAAIKVASVTIYGVPHGAPG